MSATKFTPGPWMMAAKPSSVVGWPVVAQGMGRVICSLNYADPKAFGGRMSEDGKFNSESRANGHLVAAAPDLYEALELQERLAGLQIDMDPQEAIAMVRTKRRAALAKARGEA